jgi:acyl CoA:acetate/3-ketoacid CoA transferase beta subunit
MPGLYKMSELPITSDEIMVTCIARQICDGECVAQGLATPLVTSAYLLARYTHAPHLYFMSAIGQGICSQPAPVGLARIEQLWLDRAINSIGFTRAVTEILPGLHPKEFFRPAQIDPFGNFNNIAFGKDYLTTRSTRLRLPGAGGIPDVTTFISNMHLYVPRHSRVTFVAELDVRSGLGYHPARTHGKGPQYLTSDLGLFDYANSRMRLISYHPGVTIGQIQSHTGFEIEVSPDVHETPLPSETELRLLREEIDPLGIRRLECLGGAARRNLLHQILEREMAGT